MNEATRQRLEQQDSDATDLAADLAEIREQLETLSRRLASISGRASFVEAYRMAAAAGMAARLLDDAAATIAAD